MYFCVGTSVLQDVFDHLQTPGNNPQQGQGAETPLSEVIERNLKAAVANSNRSHVTNLAAMTASPQLGKEPEPEVHTHIYSHIHSQYLSEYRYLQVCVCLAGGAEGCSSSQGGGGVCEQEIKQETG